MHLLLPLPLLLLLLLLLLQHLFLLLLFSYLGSSRLFISRLLSELNTAQHSS
jgi:hypothetical protein